MSIESFVSSLLPSFDSARINEDIESLREDIKDIVLPMHINASNLLKGKSLGAKSSRDLHDAFERRFPEYRSSGYFDGVRKIFDNILKNLTTLENKVPDLFAKDVTRETVTYQKASVLQYLTTVRFATKYAIAALNRVLGNESYYLLHQDSKIDSFLTEGQLKWHRDNVINFIDALAALNVSPGVFATTIDSIPQIVVVEKNASTMGVVHGAKVLDPMRLGFVAPRLNPIYHIRMAISEWQVRRLRAKQEEKKMLELRILRLKEVQQNKNDPQLEEVIYYNEGRLQTLQFEIEQFEKQHA